MRHDVHLVSIHNTVEPNFPSPEDPSDSRGWKPHVAVLPLDHQVLAVANTRIEGRWKAYIGAVPGQNHDIEWQDVRRTGSPIPRTIAFAMFPGFVHIPYTTN